MVDEKEYEYGQTIKQFEHNENGNKYITTLTDGEHAKFLIKLEHESFSKAGFFRACIRGYINDDPSIQKYIDEYRKGMKTFVKSRQKVLDKEKKREKEIEKMYGLSEQEIEDMYDLFDEEMGL